MSNKSVRLAVQDLAAQQDGVVSRAQARALGADRDLIGHEEEMGRWQTIGFQSVACHRMPLAKPARWRIAVWEAGEHAALDGSTALQAGGLRNFDDGIHVITPWPYGGRSWEGSQVHRSRLWNPEDFIEVGGLRRTRNDVAAARAGMYAKTNRAGATVMAMAVQQGLTAGEPVFLQVRRINRHKRRTLLLVVARDNVDGAQALGELDFARMCRQRGLPEPSRQVVCRGPKGRVYLDVRWKQFRVVVEIDGVHHDAPESSIGDALRQNAITIGRDAVLRIPVLGLRTVPEQFMDQVELMLTVAGWRRAA